jgi:hypothetical protein
LGRSSFWDSPSGRTCSLLPRGDWDPETYVPAFVRRYPFCVSKVYVDGVPRGERIVCVAKAHIKPNGTPLFDDLGAPTAHWAPVEQLLAEYESDLDLTAQMCATFAKLGLFSPFQFQVIEAASPSLTLEGMYRIDEAKLLALKPLSMKALVTRGLMGRIDAHFHSLDNFARLYQRALAAQESRPQETNRRSSASRRCACAPGGRRLGRSAGGRPHATSQLAY